MRHFVFFCIFLSIHAAGAQDYPDFKCYQIANLVDQKSELSTQTNADYELKTNLKKNQKNIILKISRIKNTFVNTLVLNGDTIKENKVIDTKFLIENRWKNNERYELYYPLYTVFINKPMKFIENVKGVLDYDQHLKKRKVNLLPQINKRAPHLNKNEVFNSIVLNFTSYDEIHIDTIFSKYPNGLFINKYRKTKNGYDFEGKFIQIHDKESEKKNNEVFNYDFWNYKGSLTNEHQFIKDLIIHSQYKYTYISDDYTKEFDRIFQISYSNEFKFK